MQTPGSDLTGDSRHHVLQRVTQNVGQVHRELTDQERQVDQDSGNDQTWQQLLDPEVTDPHTGQLRHDNDQKDDDERNIGEATHHLPRLIRSGANLLAIVINRIRIGVHQTRVGGQETIRHVLVQTVSQPRPGGQNRTQDPTQLRNLAGTLIALRRTRSVRCTSLLPLWSGYFRTHIVGIDQPGHILRGIIGEVLCEVVTRPRRRADVVAIECRGRGTAYNG